ncbi:MAG: hypothetical protein K6E17_03705 [Clostridiales bacterium]|nr:hypothetical protein [Clostridiales bacterium]
MRIWKRIAAVICACAALMAGAARAEDTPERELPDRVLMQFYENTIFVGDSQIRNLGNYFRRHRDKDPEFFPGVKCYGEYSLQMRMIALKEPLSDENAVQLNYKGRASTMTKIAKAEQPVRIFILIGLNDRIYEHMDRADRYIDKMLELRASYFPDTEIHFMSLTPVTNKWKQKVRDEIVEYNTWLEEKCRQTGMYYMDVRERLMDADGCLPVKITTDAESHLNADGFDILIQSLLDYAQQRYDEGLWTPKDDET